MKFHNLLLICLLFGAKSSFIFADNNDSNCHDCDCASNKIEVYSLDDKWKSIGYVEVKETKYGLLFTPYLHDLPPGVHGFHIHENKSCGKKGMDAGSHFDPFDSKEHLGPYKNGHLGDLPVLIVDSDGDATIPVLAPRINSLSSIKNRSLMIHKGSDNYSDKPKKLGGGGSRIACGVIE